MGAASSTINGVEDFSSRLLLRLIQDVSTLNPADPIEVSYFANRPNTGALIQQPQFLVDVPINVGCFADIGGDLPAVTSGKGSPVRCLTHCIQQGLRYTAGFSLSVL